MATEALQVPPARAVKRLGVVGLVATLTGQGLRSFSRNPIALFFTLAMPLFFLAIIGALFGDVRVGPNGDVRLAEFFTPAMAVFGAVEAAFCVLAVDTALLRERGILLRMRGTPAPPWVILAGRIGAAAVVAMVSAVVVVATGVILYGVRVSWRSLPAAFATLLLGVACFAALGLAVLAVVRTSVAAQALTNGILIPLAFISDVFAMNTSMPVWLEYLGSALPLKHFATAFAQTVGPSASGTGLPADHLAVLAAWGIGASLVAWRWFAWEPRGCGGAVAGAVAAPERGTAKPLHTVRLRRPSPWTSVRIQARYALTGLIRDATAVFFTVIFPVLLVALMPALTTGGAGQRTEAARLLLPGMSAYGIAVAAYVILPSGVAEARERGALRRLRGTPMPPWAYLAGRVTAALLVAAATILGAAAVAVVGYGVRIEIGRLPATLTAFAVSVGCFAALGFAVLTLARRSQAITALTLGTLLPLAFISDVFVIGADLPRTLDVLGDILPLKHAAHALGEALSSASTGAGFAWGDLAVLTAWGVAGMLVARRMSWQAEAG
ncbi:MAG: ABC transporter permease [Micromonospora sp.]